MTSATNAPHIGVDILLSMLDFDVALVGLVDVVLILGRILTINRTKLINNGIGILKSVGQMNHEVRPCVLVQFHVILASDLIRAYARLLIAANDVDIVDRINNLSKLLLRLVLFANFILEFLLEN